MPDCANTPPFDVFPLPQRASSFSLMRLQTSLAFAADLVDNIDVRTEDYFTVRTWQTSGSPGIFDTTNGAFDAKAGVFTVSAWPMRSSSDGASSGLTSTCALSALRPSCRRARRAVVLHSPCSCRPRQAPVDGVYYAAANLRIDRAENARFMRVILDVSTSTGEKYDNGLHAIRSNAPGYFTTNPSGEPAGR